MSFLQVWWTLRCNAVNKQTRFVYVTHLKLVAIRICIIFHNNAVYSFNTLFNLNLWEYIKHNMLQESFTKLCGDCLYGGRESKGRLSWITKQLEADCISVAQQINRPRLNMDSVWHALMLAHLINNDERYMNLNAPRNAKALLKKLDWLVTA